MIRLTREQVREVDRRAIERYGIPGIVLMENAARAVAATALEQLGDSSGRVLILCGGGNNGGDGLAAARHLHNARLEVQVGLCADPSRYQGDALTNWRIVQAMNIPAAPVDDAFIRNDPCDLIIDAIFGTGLTAAPRPPFGRIAAAVRDRGAPVIAVDIPSGLDCDTGQPLGPVISANFTVTFVAEKLGFATSDSRRYTGRVIVADIGCPREAVGAAEG